MVKIQRLFFLLIVLLWAGTQLAWAAQVKAVADRDRIADGESLNLELRVNGSPDDDPDLSPLDKDWEVLSRSQSSSIQIINGDFSRSVVYSLSLMPREVGTLTIPAICFGNDCSEPLSIQVTPADQAQPEQSGADLLLEAEATPYKLFPQQQLLFKVRLLRRVDLLQGSLTEPQPAGVDAVVQKLGDDRSYETRRGGRLYQVIERSYAIFPQASGTLEIPALRFDGEISRGPSGFDPFGNHGERIRKRTEAIRIEVKDIPSDRGGRTWLPAKNVTLRDDWQGKPRQLTVGEPATRTLTLIADGLQAAQLPELKLTPPDGFKIYPDKPTRSDDAGTEGVRGTLQQKIAFVPTRPGHYRLPPIDFDWWDVAAGAWRQAHLDAVQIDVAAAPGTTAITPASPQQQPVEAVPVAAAPAAPSPVSAQQPEAPGTHAFWPWLCLVLGLGWLSTLVLLWRNKRKRPEPNSGSQREKGQQREKAARQALLKAADNNDPDAARQALTVWCQHMWPDLGTAAVGHLMQVESSFRSEIEMLNRSLYSAGTVSWSGEGLRGAVLRWADEQGEKKAADQIPALYPSAAGKK